MRFEGRIKSWDDPRGFGFIEPTLGGQDIFVHAKAFARGAARPVIGQRVSFEVEIGAKGKKRALHVLALAGGWPGALLAQQFLRHKSAKAPFRAVFWGTVAVNVIAFVALCSQLGHGLWAAP